MSAETEVLEHDDAQPEITTTPRFLHGDAEGGFHFSPDVVTISDPGSIRAESVSALRSHLLAQHVRDGRRSLTMTAATEGVGCTFMATNLAVAMAQAGVNTLLIDANLRAPGIDQMITPSIAVPGLLDCLDASATPMSDAVCRDVIPNLSVLYAGGTAANAQELLASGTFKDIIGTCMRDFDLTIVDTPPTNVFADARRIASVMRYALVVARRDHSHVDDIKRLVTDMEADRAQILGTFLNEF